MASENANSLELSTIPRSASANRFQVNLVNKESNGNGTGEVEDEDQFNEDTEIVKQRRTSRIQAIRSSIRDSTSEKKRKESVTRFKVSDENSDSGEDENLLDGNEYDTKYGRSFRYALMSRLLRLKTHFLIHFHRHFTREALPRLDNYRNIMSIQAGTRPTLEELHNASITNKVSSIQFSVFYNPIAMTDAKT